MEKNSKHVVSIPKMIYIEKQRLEVLFDSDYPLFFSKEINAPKGED